MATLQKISPCLWFASEAEEAARFYVSVFPGSEIEAISRYPGQGREAHGQAEGMVMVVQFRLAGVQLSALNGGPVFKFNEAVSLQVFCDTQDEIDHYWTRLTAGGEESQCGWLKDRYGLSWQVVPAAMGRWMTSPERERSARVMRAFMPMKKLEIATLERAFRGEGG